jgi:FdhD protein
MQEAGSMAEVYKTVQYLECQPSGSCTRVEGNVMVEKTVTLRVNGEFWLTLICSPSNLEALTIGYLFTEGIIESNKEIAQLDISSVLDRVDVWLNRRIDRPKRKQRLTGSSGAIVLSQPHASIHIGPDNLRITPQQVQLLVQKMHEGQVMHENIGGLHACALCDENNLIIMAEDIGRHNTLDKIAGLCLIKDLPQSTRILVMSGRVSTEMMMKAGRINAAIVVSLTTPTANSIQLAESWGITLVGYVRGGYFTIYTHSERIIHEAG